MHLLSWLNNWRCFTFSTWFGCREDVKSRRSVQWLTRLFVLVVWGHWNCRYAPSALYKHKDRDQIQPDMLSINTAFLIWANDDLTQLVGHKLLIVQDLINHYSTVNLNFHSGANSTANYLIHGSPSCTPFGFNLYNPKCSWYDKADHKWLFPGQQGGSRKVCFRMEKEQMKACAAKPGNAPAQRTDPQISPSRKSQGLTSFNNRRGRCAEGLHKTSVCTVTHTEALNWNGWGELRTETSGWFRVREGVVRWKDEGNPGQKEWVMLTQLDHFRKTNIFIMIRWVCKYNRILFEQRRKSGTFFPK